MLVKKTSTVIASTTCLQFSLQKVAAVAQVASLYIPCCMKKCSKSDSDIIACLADITLGVYIVTQKRILWIGILRHPFGICLQLLYHYLFCVMHRRIGYLFLHLQDVLLISRNVFINTFYLGARTKPKTLQMEATDKCFKC